MSCSYCRKQLRDKPSINCSICYQSIHKRCAFNDHEDIHSINGWYCKHCIASALPFNHIINNDEFMHEVNQFFLNHKISFDDLQKLYLQPLQPK